MKHDPLYQQILDGLGKLLDPELFERCAADLPRAEWPTLVPIRGGRDGGMDGAIADSDWPTREEPMTKSIRARYHQGKLEPVEPLDLEEGSEVVITVTQPAAQDSVIDPIAATSGAWKDLLDCEQFEKDVYESRLIQTRPEVRW